MADARGPEEVVTDEWEAVVIGSNVIRKTSGVIEVNGEEQIRLERGGQDRSRLLLTMNLYDESGQQIAKLRQNGWPFHQERFEVTKDPTSLTLTERSTGTVVLEARVGEDSVVIPRANFCTSEGTSITVTPEALQLPGATLRGMALIGSHIHIGHDSLHAG